MDTTNETPCPQCGKTIPFSDLDEHADWHVAQNLQAEFEAEGSSSQPAPVSRPPVQDDKSATNGAQVVPPINGHGNGDVKGAPSASAQFAPPSYPPPSSTSNTQFAPPSYPPPSTSKSDQQFARVTHTNAVIEAAKVRAKDEQQMQNSLQSLQLKYNIWNSDIEPEHETEYYCGCPIHQYKALKYRRYGVQDMWSKAVMYPGEKSYNDNTQTLRMGMNNPYTFGVVSPFGNSFYRSSFYTTAKPVPSYYTQSIHQTINLNNRLNAEAQRNIDAIEPKINIWDDEPLDAALSNLNLAEKASDKKTPFLTKGDRKDSGEPSSSSTTDVNTKRSSKMFGFRKALGIRSSEEKSQARVSQLRAAILDEEDGRWPDQRWREIVMSYQEKVGMAEMIADLRTRRPTQYLHLLRAGYFEPIPTAWATQNSNPLKFSIEASAGWRGITPAWRGYEDTAEERLYWVLNHRKGSVGARLKPDFISEMEMARARMATAVEPPPEYFSPSDTCHVQHTSTGYSKQVMPPPFVAYDRPETAADDTMILLDVSGSMDFDPLRPIYNQYLVVGYDRSTQPKNKAVAKAIIRRFTDAMSNHDHSFGGYDLVTFANQAQYIGCVNHSNLERMWQNVRIGGGTRVMTGWQKVKEMHFQKHSESAVHHPVYGWQAGPKTPILRLLLLLDGEATDMDEFELDLLGLSWAHVTIFLIGVDGCPHHHRHANELARISAVNHHVSFVDAQGNMPERFVTHELLKRHLGYELSIQEFQEIEELPAYSET